MSDKTDAKKTLTASHLENWRRPPGRHRTGNAWMKTIQQDLESTNISMDEATDKALENDSTVGATHSQCCMP